MGLHGEVFTKILVDSGPGIVVFLSLISLGGHLGANSKYSDPNEGPDGEKLQTGKCAHCLSSLSYCLNETKDLLTP